MTQSPPPPRSKTMGAGVGLIAVVAAGTVLAILFGRGGGRGPGAGPGAGGGPTTGSPATQSMLPAQPTTRPLKVTIQESNYLVGGRPVDLDTLTDLAAKVPPGDGVAVMVERSPSSRAKAEQDLRDALNKKGITHASD